MAVKGRSAGPRRRAWHAVVLASSAWTFLAPEPAIAAVTATMAAAARGGNGGALVGKESAVLVGDGAARESRSVGRGPPEKEGGAPRESEEGVAPPSRKERFVADTQGERTRLRKRRTSATASGGSIAELSESEQKKGFRLGKAERLGKAGAEQLSSSGDSPVVGEEQVKNVSDSGQGQHAVPTNRSFLPTTSSRRGRGPAQGSLSPTRITAGGGVLGRWPPGGGLTENFAVDIMAEADVEGDVGLSSSDETLETSAVSSPLSGEAGPRIASQVVSGGFRTMEDGENEDENPVERRRRRTQSGQDPTSSGAGEDEEDQVEEEEEKEEETDYGEDEADDGFGTAELLALMICFGLLFCAMEVAKCYFFLGCRRRQQFRRWRLRRGEGGTRQMPIAASRFVTTEMPEVGSKDNWVVDVVDGVWSAELPQDKELPSAPGYAVAGASHALHEVIAHARRLSPGRGYRAVFAPPASPQQLAGGGGMTASSTA